MSEQRSLSIAQATHEAAQILRKAGVAEPRREAGSLLAYTVGRDRSFIIVNAEKVLAASEVARFRKYVERRAAGEPLQYITGHQEFFSLDFEVTPDVLIPRPETELLVEVALDLLGAMSEPSPICDVGTGSGCIAISILHERPDVSAIGLDISPAALCVAARNATRHRVQERFALAVSDGFAALNASLARFAMIVSNPPYISEDELAGLPREVREQEPHAALTPGPDGLLMIRRLLTGAPNFLLPGGHLLIEIGFDQHEAIKHLIDPQVWTLIDIYKDLQGIPRTVKLRKRG